LRLFVSYNALYYTIVTYSTFHSFLRMVTCLLDFWSSNHDKVSATKLGPQWLSRCAVTFHWHSVSHSFF